MLVLTMTSDDLIAMIPLILPMVIRCGGSRLTSGGPAAEAHTEVTDP